MKTLEEVCKKLEQNSAIYDCIEAFRYKGEEYQAVVLYSSFEEIMMADGWILSDRTVAQKWKLLKRNGILKDVPYRSDRAFFEPKAYCKMMKYEVYAREKKIKNFSADTASTSEVEE